MQSKVFFIDVLHWLVVVYSLLFAHLAFSEMYDIMYIIPESKIFVSFYINKVEFQNYLNSDFWEHCTVKQAVL